MGLERERGLGRKRESRKRGKEGIFLFRILMEGR